MVQRCSTRKWWLCSLKVHHFHFSEDSRWKFCEYSGSLASLSKTSEHPESAIFLRIYSADRNFLHRLCPVTQTDRHRIEHICAEYAWNTSKIGQHTLQTHKWNGKFFSFKSRFVIYIMSERVRACDAVHIFGVTIRLLAFIMWPVSGCMFKLQIASAIFEAIRP